MLLSRKVSLSLFLAILALGLPWVSGPFLPWRRRPVPPMPKRPRPIPKKPRRSWAAPTAKSPRSSTPTAPWPTRI